MKITDRIHRLKIDFKVTESLERFVYLYLIIGQKIHVVDTGVGGSEQVVIEYLQQLGRTVDDIGTILLTHSHPDHIGAANKLKEFSGAVIVSSAEERSWIEDIEEQFRARPIPNFHKLACCSTVIDKTMKDGDEMVLEEGLTIRAINSRGHSHGSLSYLFVEENAVFTGDAIPVPGDIPIYINSTDSVETLEKLAAIDAELYLSAWDDLYDRETAREKISDAASYLGSIGQTVREISSRCKNASNDEIYQQVCEALNMCHLIDNPLFKKSVLSDLFSIDDAGSRIDY